MANVHIICQSKGGVGKSFIANILAQYLLEQNNSLRLYDTDPNNQSLAAFSTLNVNYINPLNETGDSISSGSFFNLHSTIVENETDCLIDTGSSTFIQIIEFFKSMDQAAIDDLEENGYNLILHMPIVSGAPRQDCIASISSVLNELTKAHIVLWVNNYPDPVISPTEGVGSIRDLFDESVQDKLKTVITIPFMKRDTDLKFLRYMLDEKRTFNEVLDPNTSITLNKRPIFSLERRYLQGIKNQLWDAMSVLDNLAK